MVVLYVQVISKEQDRHAAYMAIATRILRDTYTIKPQRDVVKANMDAKTARLNVLTALLARPCADCNHPRSEHASRGKCYVSGCKCDEWLVVDGE